jgi:hypothetical protein
MSRMMLVRAILLVLGLSEVCQAAEKPAVFALPISNRTIHGEILLGNGQTLKFTSLEGSLVTVQGPEVGSLAVAGEIVDEASTHVRFTVFEIQDFGPGLQGLRQLEQVDVLDKSPAATGQAGFQTITASRIDTSSKVSQADVAVFREATLAWVTGGESASEPSALVPDLNGTCCVTCLNTTACGCTVSLPCGSCCADVCCPGGSNGKKPQVQF